MGESKYLQEVEPKFLPVRDGLIFQEEVMRGLEFAWIWVFLSVCMYESGAPSMGE